MSEGESELEHQGIGVTWKKRPARAPCLGCFSSQPQRPGSQLQPPVGKKLNWARGPVVTLERLLAEAAFSGGWPGPGRL